MAVAINGSGTITGTDVVTNSTLATNVATQQGLYSGNTFGRKNLFINAEFKINQRNLTALTSTGAGAYGADMWQQQAPVGFFTLGWQILDGTEITKTANRMYINFSATTKPSLGATEYFAVVQVIEGINIADLQWGTAAAQPVTFSIDLKMPAGTISFSIRNADTTRAYVAPITIAAGEANTWVRKTVTVPGCTTGTWLTSNLIGMQVWLTFGCGATFITPSPSSWQNGNYIAVSGGTNYAATGSAAILMNAPQLERGTVASTFERAEYQTELLWCMRYYQIIGGVAVASRPAYTRIPFMTVMRAAPSLLLISGSLQGADAGSADNSGFYCPNGNVSTGTSGWSIRCDATF